MIVIAVIGIVTAIGLPAYRAYIETANMTKVSGAYENAIRVVQREYVREASGIALGLVSTLPTTDEEWIAVLDKSGSSLAPGGGPMYVSGKGAKKGKKGGKGAPGIDESGAVSIKYNIKKDRVEIRRPNYLTLTGYKAVIDRHSIDIKPD